MLTLKAKSIYNDFVGIKVADFILTITLYIDKCLSLTTAIVSDRFSFAEDVQMSNEEAIEILYYHKHHIVAGSDEDIAIDLAIKALQESEDK